MHDTAVERLARLISDPSGDYDDDKGLRRRRPVFEMHLSLAEGWFSLFLLAAVVYSAIWCVQAVHWVDNINILSLTTAIGLIVGVFAAKQQRFPRIPVHFAVILFGVLLAFWQTAGAFYSSSVPAFVQGIHRWLAIISVGGTGDDDAIFLFFILALGFVLAYTSAWLVYRTRSPWLMIVANAVVLLINLSNVSDGYVIFLVIFLIAALLLLLRFNLYESVKRWQRQGLRYADDIGWDVMQAGALISIGILILSWILPYGYKNEDVAAVWTLSSNPWVQFQNTWNRVISVNAGANPANHGNFRDTLVLGGNPNLNQDIVLTVKTADSSAQYLSFVGYSTYANHQWIIGPTEKFTVKANDPLPTSAALSRPLKQSIHIVNPPGEQNAYLLGASEINSMSLPADVIIDGSSGSVIAWVGKNGFLTAGADYTVTSSVSSADVQTLRSVPFPKDSPPLPELPEEPVPTTYFSPALVNAYTQLPSDLDPRIKDLARSIGKDAHATNMYDIATALETYLRTHYQYSVDVHPPADADGVSWFLFDNRKGYCNYFASAMTLMARSQGLPARVVAGYTAGKLDPKTHQYVIRGTDAHAWTQIYFAGYGWVNFEPSASFDTFTRPLPNQFSATSSSGSSTTGGDIVATSRLKK
ncbi:MAG TPA: transglutaminase-like domain-containing protein, partial [Ktedonobacteraceae bacterium]|nr:transglutaminase-like domain-containing protein [Ktedonobacteraceae bacterium]